MSIERKQDDRKICLRLSSLSADSASPKIVHSLLSRANHHISSSKIRSRRLIAVCSLDEELKHKREEIDLELRSRLNFISWRRPLLRRIFFASKKVRSLIILNVLTVIYASDIPVLKEVESITDPAFFNMLRFSICAIPFVPLVIKSSVDFKTRSAGIELGLWVSLGYLSQALGMLTSDVGRASFISAFTVIVVALSSVLWFVIRETSTALPQFNFSSSELTALWDSPTSFPWIPALYVGLFSTALCLWAEMYVMSDISATETAIVYGLEPVWGATFTWFLLGERWDSTAWFGAVLILCGNLTVQLLGTDPEEIKVLERNHIKSTNSSQKDQYLSFSTVIVDSRKNVLSTQIKR